MKGWRIEPLGDVCDFQRGLTYAKGDEVDVSENVVLRATNIDLATNLLDLAELKYINDKVVVPDSKKVKKGSLMICTASGSKSHLGKVAFIDADYGYAFGGFMGLITPKNRLVPKYLFHLMTSDAYKDFIGELSDGANINNLKFDDLRRFLVPHPEPPEQQRIVGLLDEAFKGIATAKARAEKNLQNARALFESHLQSVFTQHGAEWDRVPLQTLLDRGWIEGHLDGNHGSDYPRKDEFVAEGVPYISANCMDDERVDMSRAKYLSPSRAALLRKGIAKNNDVLFAHNATVGPVAILHTDEEKVILGTSLTYYRCNLKRILPEYLAHYMRSFGFKSQYLQVMRQSTRNQVPITKQREFFHVVPPLDEQKQMICVLDGLFENGQRLASIYGRKLAALEALKKSLLRQAFSGELTREWRETKIVTFPITIPNITTTDLHAGILAIAYRLHEAQGKEADFGHVKAEKIAHMIEAHTGIELGRRPMKDAAGPNDFRHLKGVEHRAKMADYFSFQRVEGAAYRVIKRPKFDDLISRTEAALGDRGEEVDRLLEIMVLMDWQQAEIFATVYAAWNNLLLEGEEITDEKIVSEAREDWHPDKLKIPRERFFGAIQWIKTKKLIPVGRGKKVTSRTA